MGKGGRLLLTKETVVFNVSEDRVPTHNLLIKKLQDIGWQSKEGNMRHVSGPEYKPDILNFPIHYDITMKLSVME